MASERERLLQGRWTHSHEEDTGDQMVFRPADHPFPPARGRTSLELRPDGTYVETSPGPVDVPEESTGSWLLERDRLVLSGEGHRPGQVFEIVDAAADRLEVRRTS